MENPIIKIRKKHNLERKELAHIAGIPYDAVFRTEKGLVQHPHEKIIKALNQLGHDPEEINSKYNKYIQHLREKALEKAQVK